jgi:hypothetical protein
MKIKQRESNRPTSCSGGGRARACRTRDAQRNRRRWFRVLLLHEHRLVDVLATGQGRQPKREVMHRASARTHHRRAEADTTPGTGTGRIPAALRGRPIMCVSRRGVHELSSAAHRMPRQEVMR